jgi:hypothetical protein
VCQRVPSCEVWAVHISSRSHKSKDTVIKVSVLITMTCIWFFVVRVSVPSFQSVGTRENGGREGVCVASQL